jgi:hypothetical protein
MIAEGGADNASIQAYLARAYPYCPADEHLASTSLPNTS